jgi:hypothetical protein
MSEADEMPINTLNSRSPSVSADGNGCHALEMNGISDLPMDLWYHVTAINMNTSHVQKEGLSLIRPVALFPGSKVQGRLENIPSITLSPHQSSFRIINPSTPKQNPQ